MGNEHTDNRGRSAFRILATVFLLLQLGIIAFLVFLATTAKEQPAAIAKKKLVTVGVYRIVPRAIMDRIELPARIETWTTVELSSEVEGQVNVVGAHEGDRVAKGDLILAIDNRVYGARKLKADADLLKAKAEFSRSERLRRTESTAARDFELAQSQLALAEAELIIAQTALEKCEIRSPLDGYLGKLPVDQGEYVNAGKIVATIHDVDRVRLVFGVPENSIQTVAVGTKVEFTVGNGQPDTAPVIFLATVADRGSLSFWAEAEVANPDRRYLPGMIARVRLIRQAIPEAIVVPLTAVIPRYGAYYVLLADAADTATLREIKVAFVSGCDVVVAEGLKPGDRIVVEGLQLVREKEPLRMVEDAAGAGAVP